MLSRMPGPVALVGSGEFLPAMADFDAGLLASTGRSRPRVAILPTASWPDGTEVFHRWATQGSAHFSGLGAEVEPVLVRDRVDADDAVHAQAIGEADLIYLSGGKPDYLSSTLCGTAVGRALLAAHERGAVLVGCSAGARSSPPGTGRPAAAGVWPLSWHDGLGMVPDAAVGPHYDAFPEAMAALLVFQAPRGDAVLGIDEETAVVGRGGSWQVHGRSRVTVWRGRRRERFRAGTCSGSEELPGRSVSARPQSRAQAQDGSAGARLWPSKPRIAPRSRMARSNANVDSDATPAAQPQLRSSRLGDAGKAARRPQANGLGCP